MKQKLKALIGVALALTLVGCKPTRVDTKLQGRALGFNGYYGDISMVEGELSDFLYNLSNFYGGGINDLRDNIIGKLQSFYVSQNTFMPTADKKTHFGKDKITEERKLQDGTLLETYEVNRFEDYLLCEYGLDPTIKDKEVYHLYGRNVSENYCYNYRIINTAYFDSGKVMTIEVYDDGMEYKNLNLYGNFKVEVQVGEVMTKAIVPLYLGDNFPGDVTITSQPKDIEINYPDGVDLSLEVDCPEKVISYTWYAGGYNAHGFACSFSPIAAPGAFDNHLHLTTVGCSMSHIPVKCLIETENRFFYSSIANIDVKNSEEHVDVAYIMDFPIKAGERLDLEDINLGTGIIEYAKNGTDFTFYDVHFNNEHYVTSWQSLGFMMQSWANPHKEYNFKFVGNNVWNNSYWEVDNHQGGFGFFFHFAGQSVAPEINFKGDPITFIGGTRAVSITRGSLNIYNDVVIIGQPGRLTCGIYGCDITVKTGGSVTGTLGGTLLCSQLVNYELEYDIVLEKGSKVSATINPGTVSVGETNLNIIKASHSVIIQEADVDINVIVDYSSFSGENQFVAPLTCITSDSGDGEVNITDSNISFKVKAAHLPEELTPQDFYNKPLVNSIYGINGKNMDIKNSKINIDVGSIAFCNVYGIYSADLAIKNSDIKVNLYSLHHVGGIVAAYNEEAGSPGKLLIDSSRINIDMFAKFNIKDPEGDVWYLDSGIKCSELTLNLNKYDSIDIKTNGAPTMLVEIPHEKSETPFTPEEKYVPKALDLSSFNVFADDYEINITSFKRTPLKGKAYYVKCETLYANNGLYDNFLNRIIVAGK